MPNPAPFLSAAQRTLVAAIFAAIFIAMIVVTVRASLVRPVFDNAALLADPWFQATLCDAYFGFLTFYVWVACKERTWGSRLCWFVLVMCLGNLAMSAYVLWQLKTLPREAGIRELLSARDT